jgi:hypothetical protein
MAAVSAVAAAPVIAQVVMDANTTTTIISNINSMYSNVITTTFGLLGFVGIALPLFLSFHQKKQLKADHAVLTETISNEIDTAKAQLMEKIRKDLAEEISAVDKKVTGIKSEMSQAISKNEALMDAKIHHLQAVSSVADNKYVIAYNDCVSSMTNYARAQAETNLPTIMDVLLTKIILPKLKKKDFETNSDMKINLEKAIVVIEGINKNGRYETLIRSLKMALNEALNRENVEKVT